MIKTPLEDFTTEILAGILDSDQEICDAFANQILAIEGNGFWVSTQVRHSIDDPECSDCRIDLVLGTDEILCFVENKVESREGHTQLERYVRVLNDHTHLKKTHLRYCTKYYDIKNLEEYHNFRQFRWSDVHKFLSQWQTSSLIEEYLKFLEQHNMSDNMNFTLNNLVTLQDIGPLLKTIDSYLEKLKPIFSKYFPKAAFKDSKNLGQIKIKSRYIFHSDNIFGNYYSDICVGFVFEEDFAPYLMVSIYSEKKNIKYDEYMSAIKPPDFETYGDSVMSTKYLSDFISSQKMEMEIEEWFAEKFKLFREFADTTPQLEWHII